MASVVFKACFSNDNEIEASALCFKCDHHNLVPERGPLFLFLSNCRISPTGNTGRRVYTTLLQPSVVLCEITLGQTILIVAGR